MWQAASAFLKELEVPGAPAAIKVIEPVNEGGERALVERFRDGDRDLQVIDELWFSANLQVLVKSVRVMDPALFQIPPDFAVGDRPPLGGK